MNYTYNKFTSPDGMLDFISIEQAALNNATIITPIYDGNLANSLEEYVKELGYNCEDGSKIQVIDWEELLHDEGNVKSGNDIVLYQPIDILSEILNLNSYDTVTTVESSNN